MRTKWPPLKKPSSVLDLRSWLFDVRLGPLPPGIQAEGMLKTMRTIEHKNIPGSINLFITICDYDEEQGANTGINAGCLISGLIYPPPPPLPPAPFIPISLRDSYVTRDHTGNCDLITSLTQGNTQMVSDSRLVLKNIKCTNGFYLQIKGENVRVETSV